LCPQTVTEKTRIIQDRQKERESIKRRYISKEQNLTVAKAQDLIHGLVQATADPIEHVEVQVEAVPDDMPQGQLLWVTKLFYL
jgi:hypothetical protein